LVGLFLLDSHSPSFIIIPYSSSIAHIAVFSAWLSFAGKVKLSEAEGGEVEGSARWRGSARQRGIGQARPGM
jgi:hypothetical protein